MEEQNKNSGIKCIIYQHDSDTIPVLVRPDLANPEDIERIKHEESKNIHTRVIKFSTLEKFFDACVRIGKPILVGEIGERSQFSGIGKYFIEVGEALEDVTFALGEDAEG